jgi:hypothetical protein
MEVVLKNNTGKGGRPTKAVKRNRTVTLKCSSYERMVIQAKAKKSNLPVSEYLRELGVTGKIDNHTKTLPREVLDLTGTFNHAAANLNQVTRKLNSMPEKPSIVDLVELRKLIIELKELAIKIKAYLQ